MRAWRVRWMAVQAGDVRIGDASGRLTLVSARVGGKDLAFWTH